MSHPTSAASSVFAWATRSHLAVLVGCGALSLGLFIGCMTESDSPLDYAPPPPPGLAGPTGRPTAISTTAQETTIIVIQAPPARQQDTAKPKPTSDQHVWLAGYWTWRNDRYEWVAAHWEEPPGSHILWVRPRWERDGQAYRFYEGYWN